MSVRAPKWLSARTLRWVAGDFIREMLIYEQRIQSSADRDATERRLRPLVSELRAKAAHYKRLAARTTAKKRGTHD